VLENPRLRLRGIQASDAASILEIYSDTLVAEYDDFYPIHDMDEARNIINNYNKQFAEREQIRWGIELKAEKRLVGTCGLSDYDEGNGTCVLGYDSMRSNWNKGVMTEALGLVTEYAYEEMKLHRIAAYITPGNDASVRVLEKNGYRREGLLREMEFFKGKYQDGVVLAMIESDYEAWSAARKKPAGSALPMPDLRFDKVEDAERKAAICRSVLDDLPLWFGIPDSNDEYCANVKLHEFIAIAKGNEEIGFVSVRRNSESVAELYVLGIKKRYHRMGIGREAVGRICRELRREGYGYLEVKTLTEGRESEEYEKTRLFYQSMGFTPLDVLEHEWGKGCPCLVMIKKL
jgi:ribosomal-protein-alanine N-acetyltransferase